MAVSKDQLRIARGRGCIHAHRRVAQQDRQALGYLLDGRHFQPAGGNRADHLSAVHPPARRSADAGGQQGSANTRLSAAPHLPEGKTDKGIPFADFRWSRLEEQPDRRNVRPHRRTSLPLDARTRRRDLALRQAHGAMPASPSRRPRCSASVVDLIGEIPMEDRDTRATSTNICSPRSPAPARTASSARRATSSS